MKKIFSFILVLLSATAFCQERYSQWLPAPQSKPWMSFDSAFHIPRGTAVSLRGGINRPGALFYNTTDSSLYRWTGYQWLKVDGSGGLSGGNLGSSFRVYVHGSLGLKTLASPNSVKIDSTFTNTLTFQLDGDQAIPGPNKAYATNSSGVRGFYKFAVIDTSYRPDSSLLIYIQSLGEYRHIDKDSVGGISGGSGTPAGSNTYVQFNRSGAFAATDSFRWVPPGVTIRGRYLIDSLPVIFQPDQSGSAFLNSIFYGSYPVSLTHGGGIEAQYNTGLGKLALNANTTGASNAALGSRSLQANTTGNNNVGGGDGALITNTSGSNNTGIGMAAISTNSTGSNNTGIGFESLRMTTAGNNTGLGYRSLHENTSGANNVGLGPDAGYQNLTGSFNTWVGSSSGTGAGGSSNSNNTGIGYQAGFGNSTGSNNIFFGYRAGDNNTSESNKIVIGYDVDAPSGSNTATLGNFLFATGVTGTGTTPAGRVGIGGAPVASKLEITSTATADSYALGIGGSAWTAGVFGIIGASTSPAGGSTGSLMISSGTIVEAGSSNHPYLANLFLAVPTITSGSATVTDAATLVVAGPTTATVSGTNSSILVASGDARLANGNLHLATAGNKINIATGSNASIGTATLSSGTITISTTAVTTNSKIFLTLNTPGGTLGIAYSAPAASIVNGTSFVINAVDNAGAVVNTDTSTINWWIVN